MQNVQKTKQSKQISRKLKYRHSMLIFLSMFTILTAEAGYEVYRFSEQKKPLQVKQIKIVEKNSDTSKKEEPISEKEQTKMKLYMLYSLGLIASIGFLSAACTSEEDSYGDLLEQYIDCKKRNKVKTKEG